MSKNPVYTDVSIDLEGLGTKPNACVIAIGACALDRYTGKLHPSPFYQVVKLDSALRAGTVDGATLQWWMTEAGPAAREAVFSNEAQNNARDLASVLASFGDWWRSLNGNKLCAWGNGATADISWLESAYVHSVGLRAPWQAHYWTIRDLRTLLDAAWEVAGYSKPKMAAGTAHNAKNDAVHQAETIAGAFRAMRKESVIATKGKPDTTPATPVDDDEL